MNESETRKFIVAVGGFSIVFFGIAAYLWFIKSSRWSILPGILALIFLMGCAGGIIDLLQIRKRHSYNDNEELDETHEDVNE